MSVWEADGQLYEALSIWHDGCWLHELQALGGEPGAGPSLTIRVPDKDPQAATIRWDGENRSIPMSILERFMTFAKEGSPGE